MLKKNDYLIFLNNLTIVIIFFCFFMTGTTMAAETSVGKINKVMGTVYLQHLWDPKPSLAQANDDIFPRDKIKTHANSKTSLIFINGASLDIGENTDLEIKELFYRPSDFLSRSIFKMKLGRIRAFVGKFTNMESRFQIETTTAVTGVIGTEQLVINEKIEEYGEIKDITQAICTTGRVWVGSVNPAITDTVIIEPFQQVLIYENEAPQMVQEVTMEELGGLLQDIMISIEEDKISDNRSIENMEKTIKAKHENVVKPSAFKETFEMTHEFRNIEKRGDLLETPAAFNIKDIGSLDEVSSVMNIEKSSPLNEASGILNEENLSSFEDEILDLTKEEPWAHEEEAVNKNIIRGSDEIHFQIDQEVDSYLSEIENSLDFKEDLIEWDDKIQDLEKDGLIENIVVDIEEMPFDIHQEVAERFELEERNNNIEIEDDLIKEIEPEIIDSSPVEVSSDLIDSQLPVSR